MVKHPNVLIINTETREVEACGLRRAAEFYGTSIVHISNILGANRAIRHNSFILMNHDNLSRPPERISEKQLAVVLSHLDKSGRWPRRIKP